MARRANSDLLRRVALRRNLVERVASLMARAAAAPAGGDAVRRDDFLEALRALGRASGTAASDPASTERTVVDAWQFIAQGGETVEPRLAARYFGGYIEAIRAYVDVDPVCVAVAVGDTVLEPSHERFRPAASVSECAFIRRRRARLSEA